MNGTSLPPGTAAPAGADPGSAPPANPQDTDAPLSDVRVYPRAMPAWRPPDPNALAPAESLEDRDAGDARALAVQLRQERGAEFEPDQRAMREYLASLPYDEQQEILYREADDGRLWLNTPDGIRNLREAARTPGLPAALARSLGVSELETIRELMKNRGPQSVYWRGPMAERLQARYRDLCGAVEPAREQPSRDSAAEREIAALEKRMKPNRRGYFRDQDAQDRYRTLLARRGAG